MTPEEKLLDKLSDTTKKAKSEFMTIEVDDILAENAGITLEVISEVKSEDE